MPHYRIELISLGDYEPLRGGVPDQETRRFANLGEALQLAREVRGATRLRGASGSSRLGDLLHEWIPGAARRQALRPKQPRLLRPVGLVGHWLGCATIAPNHLSAEGVSMYQATRQGHRRRDVLVLIGGTAVAWPLCARGQKAVPVIGFLHSGSSGPAGEFVAAFRQSLSDNGYAEGQNVSIEYRWAEGHFDRLPGMAAELVARRVDVIVAGGGSPPTIAAKGATTAIPIVFANVGTPVEQGLAASLARPGGNLTGISILLDELTQKRIDLLTDLVPQAKVIGFLVNPKNPINETTVGDPQQAARTKGVQIEILEASSDADIHAAFAALHGLRAGALLVSPDPLFFLNQDRIVALASQYAVPVMYGWRSFVLAGGLISYAPSIIRTYIQAAIYVSKILKGANPAELPIEQPTKFELVINLKTAKALGLTLPQWLLARADEVIE